MAAANYKLDNLTVFVDNNGLQIDGPNDKVMALGDLACRERRLPLRFTPIKQLVIYLLPFPKGVPTAPCASADTPVTPIATSSDAGSSRARSRARRRITAARRARRRG